jgi:hypothetical protein
MTACSVRMRAMRGAGFSVRVRRQTHYAPRIPH